MKAHTPENAERKSREAEANLTERDTLSMCHAPGTPGSLASAAPPVPSAWLHVTTHAGGRRGGGGCDPPHSARLPDDPLVPVPQRVFGGPSSACGFAPQSTWSAGLNLCTRERPSPRCKGTGEAAGRWGGWGQWTAGPSHSRPVGRW